MQLVSRFRRPALVLVAVILFIGQLPRLGSGNPWDIAAAVFTLAFFVYLFVGLKVPGPRDEGNADWWRRQAIWHAKGGGAWLLFGIVWTLLAVSRDDFYYARLGSFVIPALILLLALFEYRKRHRLAEVHNRPKDRWGVPIDMETRAEEPPRH